jgi:outer membrane protein TolC
MVRRIMRLFIIFTAVFLEPEINFASSGQARVLKIGIVDCIAYALKSNSDIQIKRIEPRIKEDEVRIAKADFEPELTAGYSLRDNTKESGSALSGATVSKSSDVDVTAGASGKFVTGTEYDIEFIHEKIKSNSSYQSLNPSYTVEPKLTITQPLFKDAGIFVNKADIVINRNNKTIAEEDFKNTVADIISQTQIAYYNCIYQLENYSIAALSLKRSRDLLEINNARYKKGLISQVDLLETETASLQKEKLLISREADLKKAAD